MSDNTQHTVTEEGDEAEIGASTGSPVGFVLSHEQFPGPVLVDLARNAEQAGFSHVWTSDHLQPWQDNQGHSTHPWLTLAALGQQTRHVVLGTGVTCPTYRHHPSEVAQAFASLAVFHPGRVFLGVGTGEALNEMAGTGNFDPYAVRAARLVEALTLIRALWSGERTTFDGDYYCVRDARLYDLPAQPVPIYVAASGPKSAYLAGRHGDGWITSASDFTKPELQDAFATGAHDAGREPATMPKFVETFVVVGDDHEAARAAQLWRFTVDAWTDLVDEPNPVTIQHRAGERWPVEQVFRDWPRGTDPAVHVAVLREIIDAGGTPFVHSGQPDQRAVIEFYRDKVLPGLSTVRA